MKKKDLLYLIIILICSNNSFAKENECKKYDFKCKTQKFIEETKDYQKKNLELSKEQLNRTKEQIKGINPIK